jgi:hypothetical protein
MSKAQLVVAEGTNIAHYSSGSGSQVAATLKIGSLSGTATDGVLEGSSTYKIGYRNEDTSFSGLFKSTAVTKEGTGRLTLKTAGSTSPITVNGGTLELSNATTTAVTTGQVTVSAKASITGTATLQSLTLRSGATTLCQLKLIGNTCLTINGNLKHDGDTILVSIPSTRKLKVGDEITVFKVSGTHTGKFVVKVDDGGVGYQFDSSTFLDDGKLRVTATTNAISSIVADDELVDVYTTTGVCLYERKPYAVIRALLRPGIYAIVHDNMTHKVRIE